MIVKILPCYEVDSGDTLSNGDGVINGDWMDNGEYVLELDKIMPDGSSNRYYVSYPKSAFLRVRDFLS